MMLTRSKLANDLEDYDSAGYSTTTQSLTSSVNEYIVENGGHSLLLAIVCVVKYRSSLFSPTSSLSYNTRMQSH